MDCLNCDVYDSELIRLCEEIENDQEWYELGEFISQLHRQVSNQVGRGTKRSATSTRTEVPVKKSCPSNSRDVSTLSNEEPRSDVNVTEGGVTRQVARAMEVLHASAPGARVRVMRAAYHSSEGPGAASSYMMHSSRRVISSGTRLISPSLASRPFGDTPSLPSLPSLPLEISSVPLEMADTPETENYKVTEPDDTEISQPSKWKGSTGKSSIRMPSEESSSTDNASIIDLDPKSNHKGAFRKYSYDSENSDISTVKLSSRASPLLDAPVSLSTLKYKSLLNGSNEWNNRRKSYSFEETAPLNETISHCNDTLAMESSTDSGICKSTELVNDHADYDRKDRKYDTHEDSFKDWLNKNRQTSFNKSNQFISNHRGHNVVIEEPGEHNITVQSAGKVSITVPITLETEDEYQYRKAHGNEEAERRRKKVEFCKTELHFAAESGKVNIIATDEKPPPTNDFRRKKSAFMPMNKKPERPTTLLLEKKTIDDTMIDLFHHSTSEVGENDENTAATKSILKNKIPKPKPYLLGENMALGLVDDVPNANKPSICNDNADVPTAVSLINRQLQERRYSNDTVSSLTSEPDVQSTLKNFTSRPINAGLIKSVSTKSHVSQQHSSTSEVTNTFNSVKDKLKALQMSPTPARSKTRELRQSDLTYFGIQNDKKADDKPKYIRDRIKMQNEAIDNIFQSVRLIQQVSNSACHSEAESEETVEYQNIPLKTNFAPVPTPRSRTKFTDNSKVSDKTTILKPIVEQDSVIIKQNVQDTRRSRSRRYDEVCSPTIRSISEPPKANRNSLEKPHRRSHMKQNVSAKVSRYEAKEEKNNRSEKYPPDTAKLYLSEENEDESVPTYVNIKKDIMHNDKTTIKDDITSKPDSNRKSRSTKEIIQSAHKENIRNQCNSRERTHKTEKYTDSMNKRTNSSRKKKSDLKVDLQYSDKSSEPSGTAQNTKSQENKRKDEKSVSPRRQSGSLRRTENTVADRVTEHSDNTHASLGTKEVNTTDTSKSQQVRSTSRHSKKDSLESHKRSSANSADRHRNSSQLKSGDRNGEVHYSKDRKSRRNEYVINYDDKNGTVSSICKVSTGPGSTRKKKTSLEKIKEIPKEHKSQSKPTDKTNLLQFPDREWIPSGLSHTHKRSKTKAYIQRSCQLL